MTDPTDPVTQRPSVNPGGVSPRRGGLVRGRLTTADGVRIDAVYRPPIGDAVVPGLGIVIAHGFAGSWRRTAVYRVADVLARRAGVVAFDFRGHGESGGASTVGDREVLDLDAAVAWARSLGYRRIATLGFSMGASIVIRQAALATSRGRPAGEDEDHPPAGGGAVDAVVAVSGPSRWFYRGTTPMRRLHFAVQHPLGRVIARIILRTRVSPHDWDPVPVEPRALAHLIAPTPLLVVHGDRDRYFPVDHAHELYEAAAEPKELWIERGFGHAENAADPALVGRIAEWIVSRAAGPGADVAHATAAGPGGDAAGDGAGRRETPWPS